MYRSGRYPPDREVPNVALWRRARRAGANRIRLHIQRLGWRHKTSFDDLVTEMVEADLAAVRSEKERKNRHD